MLGALGTLAGRGGALARRGGADDARGRRASAGRVVVRQILRAQRERAPLRRAVRGGRVRRAESRPLAESAVRARPFLRVWPPERGGAIDTTVDRNPFPRASTIETLEERAASQVSLE